MLVCLATFGTLCFSFSLLLTIWEVGSALSVVVVFLTSGVQMICVYTYDLGDTIRKYVSYTGDEW